MEMMNRIWEGTSETSPLLIDWSQDEASYLDLSRHLCPMTLLWESLLTRWCWEEWTSSCFNQCGFKQQGEGGQPGLTDSKAVDRSGEEDKEGFMIDGCYG